MVDALALMVTHLDRITDARNLLNDATARNIEELRGQVPCWWAGMGVCLNFVRHPDNIRSLTLSDITTNPVRVCQLVEVHNELEVDGKLALDGRNDVEALLEFDRY